MGPVSQNAWADTGGRDVARGAFASLALRWVSEKGESKVSPPCLMCSSVPYFVLVGFAWQAGQPHLSAAAEWCNGDYFRVRNFFFPMG